MGRKDKLETSLENLFSKPTQSRRRKKASGPAAEPATQDQPPEADAPTPKKTEPTPNTEKNSVDIPPQPNPEAEQTHLPKNPDQVEATETLPENDALANLTPEGAALPPQEVMPQQEPSEGETSNPGTTQAAAEESYPAENALAEHAPRPENPPLTPPEDDDTPAPMQQPAQPHSGDTTPQTVVLNVNTNTVAEIKTQFVVFMLGDEFYGIEIFSVESIIRMQAITPVPRAPKFVRGLTNLRGSVLPVVNLHTRCGLPPQAESKDTRIVIVEIDETHVGLMVDKVTGVISIAENAIEPPSPLITTIDSNFIKNIAKIEASQESSERLIVLLNLSQILTIENTAN